MEAGIVILILTIIVGVIVFFVSVNKQVAKDKKNMERFSNQALDEKVKTFLENDDYDKKVRDIFFLQDVIKLQELAEASPTTFMLRMRKNCVRNNIPYPTGKVYRGKNGTVYHGFSNGHYGRKKLNDKNDFMGWDFLTFAILLSLLDEPSAQALEENHEAFIAENGEITPITDDLGNLITPYTDVYAGHYPDVANNTSFQQLNDSVLPHVDDLPTVTDIAKETVEREQHDHGENGTADDNDTRDFDNYSEDPDRSSGSGSNHDSGGSDSGGDCGGGGFDGGGGCD